MGPSERIESKNVCSQQKVILVESVTIEIANSGEMFRAARQSRFMQCEPVVRRTGYYFTVGAGADGETAAGAGRDSGFS
jgi:hypothetical protein